MSASRSGQRPAATCRVFHQHPDGVCTVKFIDADDANKAQQALNGTRLGGRVLRAYMWDGKRKFAAEKVGADGCPFCRQTRVSRPSPTNAILALLIAHSSTLNGTSDPVALLRGHGSARRGAAPFARRVSCGLPNRRRSRRRRRTSCGAWRPSRRSWRAGGYRGRGRLQGRRTHTWGWRTTDGMTEAGDENRPHSSMRAASFFFSFSDRHWRRLQAMA